MARKKDFAQFIRNISISKEDRKQLRELYNDTVAYFKKDPIYSRMMIEAFPIGSFAKGTIVKPAKGNKTDCDIMFVTKHDETYPTDEAYADMYRVIQSNRKWKKVELFPTAISVNAGIYDMDLIPAIRNKKMPGVYMNAMKGYWKEDNPKGRRAYIRELQKRSGGLFINTVKIFKWWRRVNVKGGGEYPHGVHLEYLVAENMPSEKMSQEDFFVETLRNIVKKYRKCKKMPKIIDPIYPYESMLIRYEYDAFMEFIKMIEESLAVIDAQGRDNKTFRKVLGKEFPA